MKSRYLAAHPFDQPMIAYLGAVEAGVIANNGLWINPAGERFRILRSTQIHHRNKCRGVRKTDERFIMAVSDSSHELIESAKNWARAEGYLLPFEADDDGVTPDGTRHLTTPELMARKAAK